MSPEEAKAAASKQKRVSKRQTHSPLPPSFPPYLQELLLRLSIQVVGHPCLLLLQGCLRLEKKRGGRERAREGGKKGEGTVVSDTPISFETQGREGEREGGREGGREGIP